MLRRSGSLATRISNTGRAGLSAFFLTIGALNPVFASDPERLNTLFDQLKHADAKQANTIGAEIELELSKSGSPSMDLLLKRGREAYEQGNYKMAYEHLSALVDHAPDFSEGWYRRAQTLVAQDRPGEALSDLEHTLTLEPRHFGALLQLAVLLEDLQMNDLALQAFEELEVLYPHLDGTDEAIARLKKANGSTEL